MNTKKTLALLSAFIIAFSAMFTGCAKKVTYKDNGETGVSENRIAIGDDYGEYGDDSPIVFDGENGDSFGVDGDNDSNVYQAPTTLVVPNNGVVTVPYTTGKITPTKATAPKTTAANKTTKATAATTTTTTTTTKPEKDQVFETVRSARKAPNAQIGGLKNCKIESFPIEFQTDDKWNIELYKGSYGTSTIGGEVCVFKDGKLVKDEDRVTVSMSVMQDSKTIGSGEAGNGWIGRFDKGSLYGGETSSLVMLCSITFPTFSMIEEFAAVLDGEGFSETSSAKESLSSGIYKNYSVDGNTISFVW